MDATHVITVNVAIDFSLITDPNMLPGVMMALGCKSKDEIIPAYGQMVSDKIEKAIGNRFECKIANAEMREVEGRKADEEVLTIVEEDDETEDYLLEDEDESDYSESILDSMEKTFGEESPQVTAHSYHDPETIEKVSKILNSPQGVELDNQSFMESLEETLSEVAFMEDRKITRLEVKRDEKVPLSELQVRFGGLLDDVVITYTDSFEETEAPDDPITYRVILESILEDVEPVVIIGYGRNK